MIARSPGVPIKQVLASIRLTEQREKVREALLTLAQTDAGRRALVATGYKGFTSPNPELEPASIAWLGI